MEFNLADLFESVADAVPDRVAIVGAHRRLTYAELADHCTRLAHGLHAAGVATGEHVGLCMRNTIGHVAAMLACYQLRAVPINVNWRYGTVELAYLFDLSLIHI